MNMTQVIKEYAYLSAGMDHVRARGGRVPPHITDRANFLYNKAAAVLTPGEQQLALRTVDALKAQYSQQQAMQDARKDVNIKGHFMDDLARSMTGMTQDQVMAAKDGKPIPVKGSRLQPDKFKQRVEQTLKQHGQTLTYDQFLKITDRVEHIRLQGQDPAKYLTEKFGKQASQMGNLIKGFSESGIAESIALTQGRTTPDHARTPTPSDTLRAQLADAFVKEGTRDKGAMETLTERYPKDALEDEGRRGDVARAMLEVESRDTGDFSNYEAPTYDLDDSYQDDFTAAQAS